MKKKNLKYLVCSSINNAWPKSKKNYLFFPKNSVIQNNSGKQKQYLKYKISNNRWENKNTLQKDYVYLNNLYEKILLSLSKFLNSHHKTKYSIRFWRIFIGPWLLTFMTVYFDRWHAIKTTLSSENIDITTFLRHSNDALVPNDLEKFQALLDEPSWNQKLYQKIILNFLPSKKIEYSRASIADKEIIVRKENLKTITIQIISKIFSSLGFYKFNKFLFCCTYLGFRNELKLNLKFNQLPTFYKLHKIENKEKYDTSLRRQKVINYKKKNKFEKNLIKILMEEMPICYLEGFKNLQKEVKKLNYPDNPKVIFTSNFLWYDILSIYYTAKRVERGTKLIYGQHGGAYSLSKISWIEEHEKKISDKYLTWGWKEKKNKEKFINPGVLFDTKKFKRSENANKISVLLCGRKYHYHSFESGLGTSSYIKYIAFIEKYLSSLPQSLQEKVILRKPPVGEIDNYTNKSLDFFNNLVGKYHFLNKGSFAESCANSKLIVNTVNSTTFLEVMAVNFPSIVIWNPKTNPIRKEASKYIQLLHKAKILHYNPISAANFTKKIVTNGIDEWWFSNKSQKAVKTFSKFYAKNNTHLLSDLKKEIEHLSNS